MFRVLVVEDDLPIGNMICKALELHGYTTLQAANGQEALSLLGANMVDLVISDIMMPQMDGYQFAAALRGSGSNLPILFVTAKDKFEDKQKGFQLGIDDYMVKPVDVGEMLLRVEALLRRARIANEHKLWVGKTLLDYDRFVVIREDVAIELPQKEFLILFKLLSYPQKIFTRGQLMDEFWGMHSESLERTVDVHITRLRDKFRANPDFRIETVRGLGYKAVKSEG